MRIVSLLPSATEMICALGLEECLVGVTHECDFPPFVNALPKVTHTVIPTDSSSADIDRLVREQLRTTQALYRLDFPILAQLRPDLIVTQALCDVCAVAEDEVRSAVCALPGTPRVVSLEPHTLAEVFDAIRHLAELTGVRQRGEEVVHALKARVEAVAIKSTGLRDRPRVALLEWLDPPFSSGHWGPELVQLAGGVEGIGRAGQRSRTVCWDEVITWEPEAIVIACCGFSVERTLADLPHLWAVPGWQTLPAVRDGRVYVVDGSQYFSRPGPRLVDSLEILAHALHPAVHRLPPGLPPPLRVDQSMMARHELTRLKHQSSTFAV
ncbi:MAG: cobalamin-binding protein [Nitrospira sp.]|nr:cobalamin-binding protein [Nitrospira sp.]